MPITQSRTEWCDLVGIPCIWKIELVRLHQLKKLEWTFIRRTDYVNIKIVGLVSQETMFNGWGDKEDMLFHILGWWSWYLTKRVNNACHCDKVVCLDHLYVIQQWSHQNYYIWIEQITQEKFIAISLYFPGLNIPFWLKCSQKSPCLPYRQWAHWCGWKRQ